MAKKTTKAVGLDDYLDSAATAQRKNPLCMACREEFNTPLKQWYALKLAGDSRAQGTLGEFKRAFLAARGYNVIKLSSLRNHVRNHMGLDHTTGGPFRG